MDTSSSSRRRGRGRGKRTHEDESENDSENHLSSLVEETPLRRRRTVSRSKSPELSRRFYEEEEEVVVSRPSRLLHLSSLALTELGKAGQYDLSSLSSLSPGSVSIPDDDDLDDENDDDDEREPEREHENRPRNVSHAMRQSADSLEVSSIASVPLLDESDGNRDSEGPSGSRRIEPVDEDTDDEQVANAENEDEAVRCGMQEVAAMRKRWEAIRLPAQEGEDAFIAGRLKTVKLTDFMCHASLSCDFSPHINIIAGDNGTGKSALLAAIQIGLGLSGVSTSRAKGLKSLIRDGASSAKIELVFANSGFLAFEPGEFGSSITLVRTIDSNSSSFRFLRSDRSPVGGKDLLKRFLKHFNLKPDNPCCILNQNHTRSLLSDISDEQLYTFFSRASLLSELEDLLGIQKAEKDNIVTLFEKKEKEFRLREKERDRLETELEKFQDMEILELRRKAVEQKMHFASAHQFETDALKLDSQISSKSSGIENLKVRIREKEVEKAECLEQLGDLQNSLSACTDSLRAKKNELEELESSSLDCKLTLEERKKYQKSLRKEIEDLTAELSNQEPNSRLEQLRTDSTEISTDLNRVLLRIPPLQEMLSQLKLDLEQLKHDVENKNQIKSNASSSLREVQSSIRREEQRLHELESDSNDPLAGWGSVHKEIRNLSQNPSPNTPPVIGPIGGLISVSDDRWKEIVEMSLSSVLESYVVESIEDDKRIRTWLLNRNRSSTRSQNSSNFASIAMPFTSNIYDISQGKAQVDHPTIFDVIYVDQVKCKALCPKIQFKTVKATILNALIDAKSIESIVVCENDSSCETLIPLPNQGRVPHGVKSAISRKGNVYKQLPSTRSLVPLFRGKYSVNITSSNAEAVQNIRSALESLQEREESVKKESRTAEADYQDAVNAMKEIEKNARGIQRSLSDLQQQQQTLSDSYEKCSEEILRLESNTDPTEELRRVIQSYENMCANEKESISMCERELSNIREALDLKRRMIEAEQKAKKDIEKKVKRVEESLHVLSQGISDDNRRISRGLDEKESLDIQRINKLERAEHFKELGMKFGGEYFIPEESYDILKKEFDELTKLIQISLPRMDQLNAVRKQFFDEARALLPLRKEVEAMRKAVETIKNSLKNRKRRLKVIRNDLERVVSSLFKEFLEYRQFSGKISFQHENRAMPIAISRPGSSNKDAWMGKFTDLSGGERSFVSISLFLALWGATDVPIRIADEFDVFMDHLTRDSTLRLIMETVLRNKSVRHRYLSQYIFISPQQIVSLQSLRAEYNQVMNSDEYVNIIQLPDRVTDSVPDS